MQHLTQQHFEYLTAIGAADLIRDYQKGILDLSGDFGYSDHYGYAVKEIRQAIADSAKQRKAGQWNIQAMQTATEAIERQILDSL